MCPHCAKHFVSNSAVETHCNGSGKQQASCKESEEGKKAVRKKEELKMKRAAEQGEKKGGGKGKKER